MANFETVGLIGPRSEQREPKEKKKDIWDQLKDGLDIANGVLGIGVNYTTFQKNRGDLAAQEDTRNGVITKKQELDYAAGGMVPAQKGEDGNYPPEAVPYKTRQGEETPLGAMIKPKAEAKPMMGWITSRDKSGKTTRTYGPLSAGTSSTLEPLPQAAPKPDKPTMGWVSSRDKDGRTVKTWGPLTAGTTSVEEPAPKSEGMELPIDKKTEVTKLSGTNTDQFAIRNQIAGYKEQFDKAGTEDEKIRIGRQMIKSLNSLQGSDAVGAEEVKRLSDALEYQLFNMTGPGKAFGRDLEGFSSQVDSTLGVLDYSIKANQTRVDELMGRTQGATSEYKPGQVVKVKSTGKTYRVGADGHSLEEISTEGGK